MASREAGVDVADRAAEELLHPDGLQHLLWIDGAERLMHAEAPGDVEFATKPELAKQMIIRALDAETLESWVAGDDVYGASAGRSSTSSTTPAAPAAGGCSSAVTRPPES